MKYKSLKNFIKDLVEVEPQKAPVVSCFINLESPEETIIREFDYECSLVAQRLAGSWLENYETTMVQARTYLIDHLDKASKSAAIYARAGAAPIFETMQFQVPLDSKIIVDKLPHIYPLIELKDSYHRFVIVITTETEARVLETTVGAVTEEILTQRPELRQRVGREWTREHYRNHKRERESQFVREKVHIIEKLMKQRGHNHLIVAGSPKMVSKLTSVLPDGLKSKLVTKMSTNPANGLGPLLRNCILEFSAAEELESHDHVDALESAVLSNGLGITGFEASREAILGGYADLLIIDQEFTNWEGREELVRLATQYNLQIETVSNSKKLKRLEGVGCLLRYRPSFVNLADGALN